jgi:hypothetical protein
VVASALLRAVPGQVVSEAFLGRKRKGKRNKGKGYGLPKKEKIKMIIIKFFICLMAACADTFLSGYFFN